MTSIVFFGRLTSKSLTISPRINQNEAMKNAELIKLYPSLPAKRKQLAALRAQARRVTAAAQALDDEIDELKSVTRIQAGIALSAHDGWLEAVGEDIRRCAEIYPNAHTKGATWGLHTYTDAFGRAGEVWHGADHSKAAALRLAEAWVIEGMRPPR